MQKEKKRLADLFIAFDKEEVVEPLKLTGISALQYLILESSYFQNKLVFHYESKDDVKVVLEQRKNLMNKLPHILLKQNFSINNKKTVFGSSFDHYYIIDNKSQTEFEIYIDYLNRNHILKSEFFARKDEYFKDIHINSLSMAENYAIYIVDYLLNNQSKDVLETIFNEEKIISQQIPFIRKIVAFYIVLNENKDLNNKLLFNDTLKEVINFNEKEQLFISKFYSGVYEPELLFPPTLALNIKYHPKANLFAKKYMK